VWPLRAAEALSLRLAPKLTRPLQELIDALPLRGVASLTAWRLYRSRHANG
jgi:hypothetical protein